MHLVDQERGRNVYFTISVTGPNAVLYRPGAFDPAIPGAVSKSLLNAAQKAPDSSYSQLQLMIGAQDWATTGATMTRGGHVPWWEATSVPGSDKVLYECDAILGSPAVADCSQIRWDQLSPASDMLVVGPGVVKFLHSSKLSTLISFM